MSIPVDKVAIGGKIKLTVEKADGTIIELGERKNDIDNSLKAKIAVVLRAGGEFGISQKTLFGSDAFTTPPTDDESGIVVHTSSTKYECLTTKESASTAYKYKYKGLVRAETSYTITGAILGYDWNSTAFVTTHATHAFSQALVDGDQLTITWEITLADA